MENGSLDRRLRFLSYALLIAAAIIIVFVLLTDSPDRDSSRWGFLAMVLGFAGAGVSLWRGRARDRS